MSCLGALLREFPDRAAVITYARLQDPDFLSELANFIQTLTASSVPVARPKVRKAKTFQPEEPLSLLQHRTPGVTAVQALTNELMPTQQNADYDT